MESQHFELRCSKAEPSGGAWGLAALLAGIGAATLALGYPLSPRNEALAGGHPVFPQRRDAPVAPPAARPAIRSLLLLEREPRSVAVLAVPASSRSSPMPPHEPSFDAAGPAPGAPILPPGQ